MSAKHDDNAGYTRDVYPDRRKAAERRQRDRDEADRRAGARLREAIRVAELYGQVPEARPSHTVVADVRFPLDPRSVCRDELVARAYRDETRR